MRSKEIVAPWYNNYYTDRVRDAKRYDEHTIGIQGADPKPLAEMHYQYAFGPVPRHFHEPRLTENWVKDTNWEIEPNTGPYQISKIDKGKFIELTRKDDWWANDTKYNRHRFNPDKVRVRVIRDMNVAYQHFLKGELDAFGLVLPQYWHEKATGEAYDNGYIAKYWFYNDLPVPSAGMYLNTADPLLADPRIRFGVAHAMDFERVIDTVLRGDYDRSADLPARLWRVRQSGHRGARVRHRQGERVFRRCRILRTRRRRHPRQGRPTAVAARDVRRAASHGASGDPPGGSQKGRPQLGVAASRLVERPSRRCRKRTTRSLGWRGIRKACRRAIGSISTRRTPTRRKPTTWPIMPIPTLDELIMTYRASSDPAERVALARRLEQMVHDSGVVIPTFQVPYTREGAWRWLKLPAGLGTRTTGALFNSQALSAGIFARRRLVLDRRRGEGAHACRNG